MFGEAAAGASAETGRGRRGAETGKRSWRLKPSAGGLAPLEDPASASARLETC